MRKNEKITALYERLSRDDFGKDDDQDPNRGGVKSKAISIKAMLVGVRRTAGVYEHCSISRTMALVVLYLTVPDFWQ